MLKDRRKILTSLILIALFLVIVLAPLRSVVFENPLFKQIDNTATTQIEASLTRALASFALARVTNGVISVIQESEVAVSPAGVGLNLAFGQILDPLNDMVERFSWVMLVALSSLGVQRFLLEASPWLGIEVIASSALLLWLAGLWLGNWIRLDLASLGKRLLFLAIIVRFAVPLTAALNQTTYDYFLAERYTVASHSIAATNTELQQIETTPDAPTTEGWWQQFTAHLKQAELAIDFARIQSWMTERSTQMIDNFLDLLVVFLLNTVILPLAFLWGIFRFFKVLTGMSLLPQVEQTLGKKIAGSKTARS
ncbi:hypothetical protein SAMN05660420_00971 [Desulfuromusa kysingii]|uniref:Uncharacterized protein n=1 Tax=Desulfuromusa kysingii TaxID=37625 RepID=A0A1H3XH03_9BACT|nr:hypothetical protein [Desulfuromusa kysingii]SDZ98667.1 hypothetical protein SAMN05660420_00971 [Desulfuromusa kysingii]